MVIYGVDAASYQGTVNWTSVDRTCEFGFEKVTEGTGYVNPYWAAAKIAMKARAVATGFVPGAYLFLDRGDGAAQADHFAKAAGNLDGFMLVVDVEKAPNGNPTAAQARACVARLRHHYPGHPIGGYIPHWYWSGYMGSPSLTFVDWLWQSSYVSGSGSPSALYAKVGTSMWGAFGGRTPKLLQFSSSGRVGGISGNCDVNAFKGTAAELRAMATGNQGDDVPLNSDDLSKIYAAVWNKDAMTVPFGTKENPTWQPSSVLTDTDAKVRALLDGQAATQAALAALAKKVGAPVDTASIVTGILAGLSPAVIAAAVADALPADLAQQVVTELGHRLDGAA